MNSVNRKVQPEIVPVSIDKIQGAESSFLDNDVPVYMIEGGTEEIMKLDFIFEAGQINESVHLLASTVNMMLSEGSEKYNAEELNSTFDFLGTYFNLFVEKDLAGLTIFFLTRHIEKVMELCREVLFKPVFPEKEFNLLMQKRLQSYQINREKVSNLASDKFFESIFGCTHPYGRQTLEEDFQSLSLSLLKKFHSEFYNPARMAIIGSGKIHPDTGRLLNSYFGMNTGIKGRENLNDANPVCEIEKKKYVVKDGALQSAIRIGSQTINKRHPDYPGLKVVDTILGGYFGSRLMKNIREEKGYSYGIASSLSSLHLSGYKVIGTEVGKLYTRQTLDEIYKEIALLQRFPVNRGELEVVRNYLSGEMVRMFDGPFAIADRFRSVWEYGLDNNYYYNLSEKIKTIGPDEISELAKTYYNIDDLHEIVAGPE